MHAKAGTILEKMKRSDAEFLGQTEPLRADRETFSTFVALDHGERFLCCGRDWRVALRRKARTRQVETERGRECSQKGVICVGTSFGWGPYMRLWLNLVPPIRVENAVFVRN